MEYSDTIAALATPAGEAAIAVIRLSGPACAEVASGALGRSRPLQPRRVSRASYRSVDGRVVDDLLFCYFEGPCSYTGEDVLELSCHGNPMIAMRVLEDLHARGARAAEPGEFTRRAFLNGRMDLTQAEAVMELIRARSDRAIEVANRQLRGHFGRQMETLKSGLMKTVATIEAYIDFPDEDLPPERKAAELRELRAALKFCRQIEQSGKQSALLREGVKTLILGEPNVGKSSLLNRLLGFDRAIVSEDAGTTRDFIREGIVLKGYSIQLMDTAGLREEARGIEAMGIRRTKELVKEADLFVLVADASSGRLGLSGELLEGFDAGNCVVVLNKSDLGGCVELPEGLERLERVSLSALTGDGVDSLRETLVKLVDARFKEGQDDAILVNERHRAALEELSACLEAAISIFEAGEAAEFVASDLRGAVDAIGRILGRIDNEEMLDLLFSSFCIGK